MITFSMKIELVSNEFSDEQGCIDSNELANTIRRTAHAIESSSAQIGDEGIVRDQHLNNVGEWIVQ